MSVAPHAPRCRRCRAMVKPDTDRCWLCDAPLDEASRSATTPPPLPTREPEVVMAELVPQFRATSVVLVVGILVATLGMYLFAPGLGILLAICVVPPTLRTIFVVHSRYRRGLPVRTGDRLVYFLGSTLITIGVLSMIVVAGVATLLASCLPSIPVGGLVVRPPLVVAVGSALAILVLTVLALQYQWQQDLRRS